MKEIDLETMGKMFPDGWVLVYTNPDRQIRMGMNNPNGWPHLFHYHDLIKDNQFDE